MTFTVLGDVSVLNHSPRCPFSAGECPGPVVKSWGLAEHAPSRVEGGLCGRQVRADRQEPEATPRGPEDEVRPRSTVCPGTASVSDIKVV